MITLSPAHVVESVYQLLCNIPRSYNFVIVNGHICQRLLVYVVMFKLILFIKRSLSVLYDGYTHCHRLLLFMICVKPILCSHRRLLDF